MGDSKLQCHPAVDYWACHWLVCNLVNLMFCIVGVLLVVCRLMMCMLSPLYSQGMFYHMVAQLRNAIRIRYGAL